MVILFDIGAIWPKILRYLLCVICYLLSVREGAMVMGHVRGKTLKIIVKNLLATPEIHVKNGSPPLYHRPHACPIPIAPSLKLL